MFQKRACVFLQSTSMLVWMTIIEIFEIFFIKGKNVIFGTVAEKFENNI